MPSDQIKQIRIQSSHQHTKIVTYTSIFSKKKIPKEQHYSQVLELRITFVSSAENTRFQYYLTQPKSMLEWKIIGKLDRNLKLI